MTYFPLIIFILTALTVLTLLTYRLLIRVEKLEKKSNWYQR